MEVGFHEPGLIFMKIHRNIFYENWIKIDPYTQHELINIKNNSFWQQHAVLAETSTHTPKQVSWRLPLSDKIVFELSKEILLSFVQLSEKNTKC